MRWLRGLLLALATSAVLASIVGAGGFVRQPSLRLLKIVALTPHAVEGGDRVAIQGEGFPAGKPARVTFRGSLFRASERPEQGVELAAVGEVVDPGRVELECNDAFVSLFCGVGPCAGHTTFEGAVEVAFRAAAPGEPPVTGVLEGVVLDVLVGAPATDPAAEAEGARFLDFVGLHASLRGPATGGLFVDGVEPGSRAASAGLTTGDVIVSVDHLHVESLADAVPAPGENSAVIGLVRAVHGSAEVRRALSISGFRGARSDELFTPALFVVAALALVLFFAAPPLASLDARLQRVVSRVRERRSSARFEHASAASIAWSRWSSSWSTALGDVVPPRDASAAVDAVACAALVILPFGQYLFAAKLDVAVLFVSAATAVVTATLLASASRGQRARAALHVLFQHGPAAASLATVVILTGSMQVQEIGRAQGGWPWQWLAFACPPALLALVALLLCARIAVPSSDEVGSVRGGLGAACRAQRIVVAGLASALFLGGWSLPGVPAASQDAQPVLQAAGAVCFALKAGSIRVGLAWLHRASPPPTLARRSRAMVTLGLPLSAAALAGAALWTAGFRAPLASVLFGGSLSIVLAVAAIAAACRILHGLSLPASEGQSSSFL